MWPSHPLRKSLHQLLLWKPWDYTTQASNQHQDSEWSEEKQDMSSATNFWVQNANPSIPHCVLYQSFFMIQLKVCFVQQEGQVLPEFPVLFLECKQCTLITQAHTVPSKQKIHTSHCNSYTRQPIRNASSLKEPDFRAKGTAVTPQLERVWQSSASLLLDQRRKQSFSQNTLRQQMPT